LLWAYAGVSAPFVYGSLMATISAFLFIILEKNKTVKSVPATSSTSFN